MWRSEVRLKFEEGTEIGNLPSGQKVALISEECAEIRKYDHTTDQVDRFYVTFIRHMEGWFTYLPVYYILIQQQLLLLQIRALRFVVTTLE